MASNLSLSQSLSNSLILHQNRYENRRQKRHSILYDRRQRVRQDKQRLLQQSQENLRDDRNGVYSGCGNNLSGDVSETPDGYGVVQLVTMTALSFGYSLCVEFESIYGVMSMQYFGVPIYLVSVPGLASGALNSFLVPLLGRFSDKGPNPLKRKLFLLVFTSTCLMIGYTTLVVCSWVKLTQASENLKPSNDTALPNAVYSPIPNDTHALIEHTLTSNQTISSFNENVKTGSDSAAPLSVIAVFSILPFVLYDTGYDTSIAMSRASVLEVVPVHQRNSVLNICGMMTGFAGVLIALFGIVDFPGIFGLTFGIDGYALTLIMFSVVYGICGFLTAACSISKIWTMHCDNLKKPNNKSIGAGISKGQKDHFSIITQEKCLQNSTQNSSHDSSTTTKNPKHIFTNSKKSYFHSLTPSDETLIPSRKGSDSSPTKQCYNTFDLSVESSSKQHPSHLTPHLLSDREHKPQIKTSESTQQISFTDKSFPDKSDVDINNNSDNVKETQEKTVQGRSLILSTSKSYEKALGKIHLENLKENRKYQNSPHGPPKPPKPRPSLYSFRFCLCLAAIYLCTTSVCVTTVYQGNSLTMEVYEGEPLAQPGSPGRIRYEAGVRMSSFGVLAAFSSFLGLFLASSSIINRFGAVGLFVMSNSLATIGAGLFGGYPRTETYFCMMVTFGINKFTLMAVVFIMATIYSSIDDESSPENHSIYEDNVQEPPSSSPASKAIGQVMALVALATPVTYIFMSAIMGPLMDVTGSALPPVYYCTVTGAGAVVIGAILWFLK